MCTNIYCAINIPELKKDNKIFLNEERTRCIISELNIYSEGHSIPDGFHWGNNSPPPSCHYSSLLSVFTLFCLLHLHNVILLPQTLLSVYTLRCLLLNICIIVFCYCKLCCFWSLCSIYYIYITVFCFLNFAIRVHSVLSTMFAQLYSANIIAVVCVHFCCVCYIYTIVFSFSEPYCLCLLFLSSTFR